MIDYRKAGKECREAYFEYREAPIVCASEVSAASFVAGWNAAIASMGQKPHEEPAKEPPKKWRILEPGEVVCSSDLVNAKLNLPSDPPNGLGWIPVIASVGATVCEDDSGIFARLVADEPAKESKPD